MAIGGEDFLSVSGSSACHRLWIEIIKDFLTEGIFDYSHRLWVRNTSNSLIYCQVSPVPSGYIVRGKFLQGNFLSDVAKLPLQPPMGREYFFSS